MKKFIVAFVLGIFLISQTAAFSETKGSVILQDTLYGTLTGAIIGTAAIVFTDDPGDNMDYIAYGAATGAIVGAAFGFHESTALVQIEDGKTRVAMPTIKTDLRNRDGHTAFEAKADVVKVNF